MQRRRTTHIGPFHFLLSLDDVDVLENGRPLISLSIIRIPFYGLFSQQSTCWNNRVVVVASCCVQAQRLDNLSSLIGKSLKTRVLCLFCFRRGGNLSVNESFLYLSLGNSVVGQRERNQSLLSNLFFFLLLLLLFLCFI